MNTNQRDEAFNSVMHTEQYDYPASPAETLADVKEFYDRSLAGDYYAPFDMNSKNFMDVPEETDAWFARLDALFIECTKLSNQSEYHAAIEPFGVLYDGFVEKAVMVIQEDSHRSCFLKIYPVVESIATSRQMRLIDNEISRRKLNAKVVCQPDQLL